MLRLPSIQGQLADKFVDQSLILRHRMGIKFVKITPKNCLASGALAAAIAPTGRTP
jgi:hypothetical protein